MALAAFPPPSLLGKTQGHVSKLSQNFEGHKQAKQQYYLCPVVYTSNFALYNQFLVDT